MKRIHVLILAALASAASSAHADEPTSGFSFSGFGTAAAVKTNTDEARFSAGPAVQLGGVRKGIDGAFDDKLGLQGTYKFNDQLSATVQLLSKKAGDDDLKPRVEWAYLKYEPTSNLSMHAGRIRVPAFLISDSKDVGYSQTWVRTPAEVYAQFTLSYITGVDLVYRAKLGDFNITLQPQFGSQNKYNSPGNPTPYPIKASDLGALNATAEIGNWLFRLGTVQVKISGTPNNGDNPASLALTTFNQLAPGLGYGDLANKLAVRNDKTTFSGVAGVYDDGTWTFQSEYTVRRSDTLSINNSHGWYALGSYRVGKWTPYLTYATIKNENPDSYTDHNGIPVVSATVSAIVSAVYQSSFTNQHTVSVGTRYDLMKNVALKAQFDRITTGGPAGNQRGLFAAASPAFMASSHNVNVMSLFVDFIF